jgi:ATPase subunit of ABC transporter with duplicated ATPase domains
LFLKGKKPSLILSEGEQKVIALADFLAESRLSVVNKGIIFDDPVNSLDEERKSNIAERLVKEALIKQVIIFTHDLVFLNALYNYCGDFKLNLSTHWVESIDKEIGVIALNNSPSLESDYKKSSEAQFYRDEAKKLQGKERERSIKNGFTALRTNYEALTIFKIFNGAIERFNERISIDRLKNMVLNKDIIDEVVDSYDLCCRYMEGHLHSNRYAAKKPTFENLVDEITRFDTLNSKIKAFKNSKKDKQ